MKPFPVRLTRLRAVVGAAVLALVIVGGTAATAEAGHIGPCAQLHSFFGTFNTGSDDLRGDSQVIMWLQTTNGNLQLQSFQGPFGNDSTNNESLGFTNSNLTVNSCTVTGVKMEMISHPSGFETTDNWNLNSFELQGYSTTGTFSWLFSSPMGSPLHRFTGSDPFWSGLG